MKNGLKKRGKYYHYKHWDSGLGKNVWRSTRETTWEGANLWVEANVRNPKREKLLEEAMGLKPIKWANFRGFVEKEYWPYAEEHNKESTVQANFHKMNWLEQFFGEFELADISEEAIEEYKMWRKKQRKKSHGQGAPKGATINRELKVLSKVCKIAVKRGYLREDPTRTVEYYREKQEKIQIISKHDFYERFLPHCNARDRYATKELYDFAFRTGARRSEITGLKWTEVEFQNDRIAFLDTKNGEVRNFPMTRYLKEMLARLHETRISEYVFPGQEGKRRADVMTAFKKTLERAGLPDMRFHALRHSFVAACASMGMTWEQTSALTGHKTYAMYLRYKHLFEKEQKRLLERWDDD